MAEKIISIARNFSPSPAGRYYSDGPFSGEKFRKEFLVPALEELTINDKLIIDLDGTDGMGSSFLEEAFGGLTRSGWSRRKIKNSLIIKSTRQIYVKRIWSYIDG